ncbi:hypothetical protein FOXG_16743 [Fusarium oxysporum f. sp. lycopersici 4287]|uniref:Uncharacterized protein n=2 Tax=Fusarium oxysporum TaxID=5507 RepID=A0A0J9W852_FUSO4|nr:hypothetical protein FOXG_16680 [Fusarium oxysporum f. sp. lycopersici 4287]XP_018257524.1 hypothetical protein FOXG_16743 [Fusarium oxysporum f. sp. lycopersici 4287]KAJ9413161.1 hypothetical protein QL093DRAFT_2123287 [Fusarium oxysporum]KNB19394.1 hypothetical protein FOXG_16680 [Fusarium oxysporum f. sp. lycopersici 4287]KNB19479.1 hypothetical protein FOXG_16743 [Fusarium oxysporum f. sp. lycopersici 4287]
MGNEIGAVIETGGKVVEGAFGIGANVAGSAIGTVAWAAQALADPNEALEIVKEILRKAHDDSLRSLLSQVTRRIQEAVSETEANIILEAARTIFCKGAGNVVKNVVFKVMRCTLVAIGQTDFAQALQIWTEIFTNDANRETLVFILERKSDLVLFLIGLVEPAKLYATALSMDGSPNGGNVHGRYNRYNELDLTRAMNRHTLICQLQRLAKSLSHIFLMGKQNRSLDQLPINTTLRSDFGNNGTVILPPALTTRAPDNTPNHGEQWLFVNGICGEYFWFQLYCEKLRDTFNRDIRGVFNRSDGILWDLIECAGERDTNGRQNALIERTPSSMAAQRALSRELSAALQNVGSNGYIVMIAYSQGCLLLRLVLQDFVRNNMHRAAMDARLRVFTFGNPSIDWIGTDAGGNRIPLCERVNWTEHFANERDFVAQLGVLSTDQEDALRDLGYIHDRSSLFINRGQDWIGHLFGTQYSLRSEEYVDGNRSKLFLAAGNTAMAP